MAQITEPVSIREILAQKNIILKGADKLSGRGFTQIPNHVLEDARLSFGARITYAMLLRYAWHHNFCFPGQDTLAKDMGTTDRQIRNLLTELKALGYLEIKRRGLGKTNVYILNLRIGRKSVSPDRQ
jgi:hypothetical protein